MQANDLLTDCQHSIRKRSCSALLMEVIENLIVSIENNQPVDMFFLDFNMILESVPQQWIVTK